jgi:hypothetical protein
MLTGKQFFIFLTAILLCSIASITRASDFIIIDNPNNYYGTVLGKPLAINGTSSQPNFTVRLTINSTSIGTTTTDAYGNWSFTYNNLTDGSYTVTAELVSNAFEVLAITSNSFTIDNPETISFTSMSEGDTIFFNPDSIIGTSSLPNTTVQLYMDGNLIATTTTDAYGNWSVSYIISTNGSHTFVADLIEYYDYPTDLYPYPIASASVDITASIPILFPSGKNQVRVLDGYVPTTGSGSGSGYTYTVSGSIMTINFTPVYSSIPAIIATGQRSSGASTVTIASISTSAVSISFSSGTQQVHFTATALQ